MPYKTADVRNIVSNLREDDIIAFLLDQERKGTSYELLEDIKARIAELPGERAKILVRALFRSMKKLNQTVRKSWLSMSTGAYAEHMMLDLIERIPADERAVFISELIENADLDALQSIATVINMIELGYGRLAAEGQERNYKKVVALNELLSIEIAFTSRVKGILETNSLFAFTQWGMVPSLDKGTHASSHDIFVICCVILSRRTSSTPPSDALQITKISMVEVVESRRDQFCVLQGT